jgi:hypothetical protein
MKLDKVTAVILQQWYPDWSQKSLSWMQAGLRVNEVLRIIQGMNGADDQT